MARFRLVIDFDDPLADTEGIEYAQMAASGALFALRNTACTGVTAELVDSEDVTPRWQGGVDWLEFCETDEANDEDTYQCR